MYKKFFGFTEKPFQLVPNPAYLYLSKSHKEALAHLTYSIAQGDGFVEITGEVGTGKTTLCRVFLESLSENSEAAYIFNPKLNSLQLLKAINDDFSINSTHDNIKDLIDVLNAFLLWKKSENKTVLLIIDEAQNLDSEVLEQLRLLSNLETSTSKLIQIILVGQPELTKKLDSYELRQLGQRITLSCSLRPLSYNETCEYVRHRIHVASVHPGARFDTGALKAVYDFSKGIPRLINIVCDRTLLTAFVMDSLKIRKKTVQLAVKELKGSRLIKKRTPVLIPALSIAAIFLLVFSYFIFRAPVPELSENLKKTDNPIVKSFAIKEKKKEKAAEEVKPEPAIEEQPANTVKSNKNIALIDILDDAFLEKSRRTALQLALKLWQAGSEVNGDTDLIEEDSVFFRLGTKQNGMAVYMAEEDFSFLLRLNLPAILELEIPGYSSSLYLLFSKYENGNVVLTADDGKTITMRKDQIDIYWTGISYIPWKNFLGCTGTIPQNTSKESVLTLKMLMREIGYTDITVNSDYDDETEAAVKDIQERHGIEVDGFVGALTKIAMYKEAYATSIPHIMNEIETSEIKEAMKPAIEFENDPNEDHVVKVAAKSVEGLATKIKDVKLNITDECVEINISGENINDDYNIFSIPAGDEEFARIVCDIPCLSGVKTRGEQVVPVETCGIDKVRYFTHKGKMRIVVDLDEDKLKMLSYKANEENLVISVSFGQKEQKLKITSGEMEVREEKYGFGS